MPSEAFHGHDGQVIGGKRRIGFVSSHGRPLVSVTGLRGIVPTPGLKLTDGISALLIQNKVEPQDSAIVAS